MSDAHDDMSGTDCDKCHTRVPSNNDLTLFLVILTGDPMFAFQTSRHLLPVVVEGATVCEGSPSRAQYLEGQARDARGQFPYREDAEAKMRAAYAEYLEVYDSPASTS